MPHVFKRDKIKNVMYTCCILYNIILKYKGKTFSPVDIVDTPTNVVLDNSIIWALKDTGMHHRLRFDLSNTFIVYKA